MRDARRSAELGMTEQEYLAWRWALRAEYRRMLPTSRKRDPVLLTSLVLGWNT